MFESHPEETMRKSPPFAKGNYPFSSRNRAINLASRFALQILATQ
jgi:hypothetical protein